MRVLLLKKEKKKDSRSPIFWLYILACILCCFVCFNKHTRTRVQNFKLCCKFMFRQILSSNCLQIFKAPCGRKWTKGLPNVGHMLQCHLCMPSNSKSPSIFYSRHLKCSVCVVTYSILMSSSHVQKKHKCLTNLVCEIHCQCSIKFKPRPPTSLPYKPHSVTSEGGALKAQFDLLIPK